MIRPPPKSTLFPYTTLFRSRRNIWAASTSSRPTTSTPPSPGRRRPAPQSRSRSRSARSDMYPRPDRLDDIDAIPGLDEAAVGRIFREESGRSIAALIRAFGDIDLAEDAVQESFTVALRAWARDGLPPNPGGWITTTARNRAIDRLRREARGQALLGEVAVLTPASDEPDLPEETRP